MIRLITTAIICVALGITVTLIVTRPTKGIINKQVIKAKQEAFKEAMERNVQDSLEFEQRIASLNDTIKKLKFEIEAKQITINQIKSKQNEKNRIISRLSVAGINSHITELYKDSVK